MTLTLLRGISIRGPLLRSQRWRLPLGLVSLPLLHPGGVAELVRSFRKRGPSASRLGTEHRSQNKNVFQTSTEQKQNNRTKFPNKANGPNKTTEQKPTSERLKTNSPRTSNKTKAEQNKKHCSLPCLAGGRLAYGPQYGGSKGGAGRPLVWPSALWQLRR